MKSEAKHIAPTHYEIVQDGKWVRVEGIPITVLAAAPDLLEALQELMSVCTETGDRRPAFEKSRSAVRRALGEDSK